MNDKHTQTWKRRKFIKATAGSATVLLPPGVASAIESCKVIPSTEDGPLYPAEDIPWLSDLTVVPGQPGSAAGQVVYLFGTIRSVDCQPTSDATVEIWQADNKGYYKHPRHTAPEGLDPSFQYFGKVKVDDSGRYLIKTIKPKWYRIFDIERAAHIHIKVRSPLNGVYTSEVYFSGDDQDALRDADPVFQSRRSKEMLIADRNSSIGGFGLDVPTDDDAAYCNFDVTYRL